MMVDYTKRFFDAYNKVFLTYRDRLRQLYDEMDAQYNAVADSYGFKCTGCRESCCETRFYHHTYAEYMYLLEGFYSLDPGLQKDIQKKALTVFRKHMTANQNTVRIMCPLNHEDLCRLYTYRPMICRLHGIPHELQKPGQPVSHGPGCELFARRCKDTAYKNFDRTPFYRQMAMLEKEFRQSAGLYGKFKMTIAQMLINEKGKTP